jgi:transcriptional antiterminator NusG
MGGDERTPAMTDAWRVLHVVANHEKRVGQYLAARSLEYYLPLYTEKSEWSDRTVTLNRPLFPGYVFVRFADRGTYAALTTPGVLRVLGSTGNGIVPATEIERIRTALSAGYSLRPHPPVSLGMHVRILCGVFAGQEGLVAELRNRCRVVLTISEASQYFSLETSLANIKVLDQKCDTKTIDVADRFPFSPSAPTDASISVRI